MSAGIYVHFPYCITICSYCDFDRQAHGFELIPRYLEAVEREIRRQPRVGVHSVFFGGGTPSLMESFQVARVLDAIAEHFTLAPDAEITLEANPDDLAEEKVRGLRAAGVNRMSIGVQSFDDATLRVLGRRHSAERAEAAVRAARAGGMENLSLDLMYGLPDGPRTVDRGPWRTDGARHTMDDGAGRTECGSGVSPTVHGLRSTVHWEQTLERALALEPDHLSCYLLTLESSVPMGRWLEQGRVALPQDEEIAGQYRLARDMLAARGFEQYEISNWARPGRASRHNLTYWRDEAYLGIGAGAASSWHGRRYKTTPHVETYIRSSVAGEPQRTEQEQTGPLERVEDYLALTLRLREGLESEEFERRFGVGLSQLLGEELDALLEAGHLEWHADRLRVAESSLLVTNEVLVRLHGAARGSLASSSGAGVRSA